MAEQKSIPVKPTKVLQLGVIAEWHHAMPAMHIQSRKQHARNTLMMDIGVILIGNVCVVDIEELEINKGSSVEYRVTATVEVYERKKESEDVG